MPQPPGNPASLCPSSQAQLVERKTSGVDARARRGRSGNLKSPFALRPDQEFLRSPRTCSRCRSGETNRFLFSAWMATRDIPTQRAKKASVGRKVRRQDLNSDRTVEPSIESAIHLAHAASTQRRKNFIWTEFGTRGKRHTRGRDYRLSSTLEELARFWVCCRQFGVRRDKPACCRG